MAEFNYGGQHDQDEKQQAQQLVPVEANVAMDMMAAALGSQSAIELSNFDGDANRQWELSSLATSGDSISSDDSVGTEIDVKYIYMHGVTIQGQESGEVVDVVRTVLIDEKNNSYVFVSAGVALDAFKMLRIFGKKPFVPAKRVKVVSKTTARKRKILTLIPVIQS